MYYESIQSPYNQPESPYELPDWEKAYVPDSLIAKVHNLLATPESERADMDLARAKQSIFMPHPGLVNSSIDIIDSRDAGTIDVYARLDVQTASAVKARLDSVREVCDDKFEFTSKAGERIHTNGIYYAADSYQIAPGITARLADGRSVSYHGQRSEHINESMRGMLRIEIDASQHIGSERQLAYAIDQSLEISGLGFEFEQAALSPGAYTQQRLAHYLVEAGPLNLHAGQVVFTEQPDGRVVLRVPGLHKQYEAMADGLQAVYHEMPTKNLAAAIKNGALYSTIERYSRGLTAAGRSAAADLMSGGGDMVYTYCTSGNSRWPGPTIRNHSDERYLSVSLLFSSEVLDRIDASAFDNDAYGSAKYGRHVPPHIFFNKETPRGVHELDFETSLPFDALAAIITKDEAHAAQLIRHMYSQGIYDINGYPLESLVITEPWDDDIRRLNGVITA